MGSVVYIKNVYVMYLKLDLDKLGTLFVSAHYLTLVCLVLDPLPMFVWSGSRGHQHLPMQRLLVSITRADLARHTKAFKPLAPLSALAVHWSVLIATVVRRGLAIKVRHLLLPLRSSVSAACLPTQQSRHGCSRSCGQDTSSISLTIFSLFGSLQRCY